MDLLEQLHGCMVACTNSNVNMRKGRLEWSGTVVAANGARRRYGAVSHTNHR